MSRNYGGNMVANLFVKFGADTEEYQKKMRAAVTRMLFAAESLTQAGRIMSTAITAPMIAVGVASLKTAMEFEAAMTRMESLVGVPAETLARWKPVILDMAGTVGKSANELAEALFFITSNGFQTDEALRVLEATAKASAVGMGETKDIAIAATSALNAYGKGAMTANEAVAVLIGTVREGNLEAAELPQSLSKLLPVASAMGVEFHEAGAGIAAMSRSGTSARLAAFGLRAIMIGIMAPTKSAAEAMDSVNLSSAKLKAVLAGPQGLKTALWMMKDAVDSGKVSMKDLLPNQKALVAALQILGKSAEDNIEIFDDMAAVVGDDVNDAFNKGAGTMDRTFKQAMGNLSAAAVELGDNMAPMVDNFAKLARQAAGTASEFNQLDDYWKGLITSATFTVAAVGPVLYFLGSLARISARFTGLGILFRAAWIKNVAQLMITKQTADAVGGSMTRLGMTKTQLAGSIGVALVAGYQFGKWLDHTLGITDKLNEKFGRMYSALDSVTDGYAKSEAGLDGAAYAARRLAVGMGDVEMSVALVTAVQEKNTVEVAKLIKKINEKAQAYNKATIKVDGLTEAEEKHKDQQEALKEAEQEVATKEAERLKKLRETHGLLTSQEVIDKMKEMTNNYADHKNAGVDIGLLNKSQVEDWQDLVELAKVYGVATTDAFKKIGESMLFTGDIENSDYYKLWSYYIPQAIDAVPGKVLDSMLEVNGVVRDQLKGGMDKGWAEGLDNYSNTYRPQLEAAMEATYKGGFAGMGDELRDKIVNMVELISPLKIPVVPDEDVFNNALRDIMDGQIPDTRG